MKRFDIRRWGFCMKANDSGQTMVEFALSAMMFFLLIFATIDFANLFYHKLTLQNAVRQAGRYAITGQSIPGSGRYASIQQTLENASVGIINTSNLSDVTIRCQDGGFPGGGCPNGSNSAGGSEDIVTIAVTYPYHFITPVIAKLFSGGTFTINVSAKFVNEPFPPSED
jgi:hypothetical protein